MWTYVLWISLAALGYVYVAYPLLLWGVLRLARRPARIDDGFLPGVTLVIAAWNEAAVIERKLLNALAMDYPADRLEIVVASDGSDDGTDAIVERFADKGVRLHRITPRGGKTRALNRTIPTAAYGVIVLSDANTMFAPDAIRQLVRYLADARVGAVTGDVQIVNEGEAFGESEGLYYRYERFIQQCESDIGSIVGVDGAMYAFRKSCFRPPSDPIILDDFVTSMNIVRQGRRVIYNPEARAYENATPTVAQEFRRKSRIAAGGVQAILKGEGLPGPRQVWEWFTYVSHKLLRWLTAVFMAGTFAGTIVHLGTPFYNGLFALELAFAGLSLTGWALNGRSVPAVVNVPFYFCMVNLAILQGLLKGLLGMQKVTWKKADRESVEMPPSCEQHRQSSPSH